jgi:hypothetical protein
MVKKLFSCLLKKLKELKKYNFSRNPIFLDLENKATIGPYVDLITKKSMRSSTHSTGDQKILDDAYLQQEKIDNYRCLTASTGY